MHQHYITNNRLTCKYTSQYGGTYIFQHNDNYDKYWFMNRHALSVITNLNEVGDIPNMGSVSKLVDVFGCLHNTDLFTFAVFRIAGRRDQHPYV